MRQLTVPMTLLINALKVMLLVDAIPMIDSGHSPRTAEDVVMFHFVSSTALFVLLNIVFLKLNVASQLPTCVIKEMLQVDALMIPSSGELNLLVLLVAIVVMNNLLRQQQMGLLHQLQQQPIQ